jgi:hypothetical protein
MESGATAPLRLCGIRFPILCLGSLSRRASGWLCTWHDSDLLGKNLAVAVRLSAMGFLDSTNPRFHERWYPISLIRSWRELPAT